MRIAIDWPSVRQLQRPTSFYAHQRPLWNVRRWRFSVTVHQGGHWQVRIGPWMVTSYGW